MFILKPARERIGKMYKFLFALLVVALASIGSSQAEVGYELGLDFVSPQSDLGDIAAGGGGARFDLNFPLGEKILGVAGIGAIAYGGVDITVGTARVEVQWYGAPIDVGVRVPIGNAYAQLKAGVIVKTGEVVSNLGTTVDESTTSWVITPGFGLNINPRFAVAGEYGISDDSWQWIGVRGIVRFGGNR